MTNQNSPILSIVSGTYNRLPSLRRMMDSVRSSIPSTIPYEFVIVDGGSIDGTLDYLRLQSDVTLVEHGELKGAIRAFCDGAHLADGDYVLLANDDVTFYRDAIVRALVHLETHPACGAVGFMDNRPVVQGGSTEYTVKLEPAIAPDGQGTSVPYAQIGMFRRWLGDVCGWWGDSDPVMGKARTYGGDNYLSSRIWETGYSVDVVRGVKAHDHIIEDELRAINRQARDKVYFEVYPLGPHIAEAPVLQNPQREKLRILYLPIYEPGPLHARQRKNKRGLRQALSQCGLVWELDYLNEPIDILDAADAFQPHLILSQFHDARQVNRSMLAEMRRLAPNVLIVNWNGDARGLTEPAYLDMLHGVDLQLVVNAGPLAAYAQAGIMAAYWQIGIEEPEPDAVPPDVTGHDVLFLGNCYNNYRRDMEQTLRGMDLNVGLYGMGWRQSNGECLYDFLTGEALYRKATIAIGDTFPGTLAFVSNRTIQALAAGAFLLQQTSLRLDEYTGLMPGVHYVEWTDLDDLKQKVAHWIAPEHAALRARIAQAGHEHVWRYFTFEALVNQLFKDLIPLADTQRTAQHA